MTTCAARVWPDQPDHITHTCNRADDHSDGLDCLICHTVCDRADHQNRHQCPWCGGQWVEDSKHIFLPSPITRFHDPHPQSLS